MYECSLVNLLMEEIKIKKTLINMSWVKNIFYEVNDYLLSCNTTVYVSQFDHHYKKVKC